MDQSPPAPPTNSQTAEGLEREVAALRLLEIIPQAVWRTDANGVADYTSASFTRFVGVPPERLLGTAWTDLLHPDDRQRVIDEWAKCRAQALPVSLEFRVEVRGQFRWVLSQGNPFFDPNGRLTHYYGTWTDLHDRIMAEQARLESEERFQAMADSAPVLIWISGTDRGRFWFNRGWLNFTGRQLAEETGDGWSQSIHPDDVERVLNAYRENFALRREFKTEYRLRHHTGEYRWILGHGVPRFTPDGNFDGYIGACLDIHEQKLLHIDRDNIRDRMESVALELHLEKVRFDRTAQAAQLGVWFCDLPFDKLRWNDRVKEHFWLSPEQDVDIALFYERIHPDDREPTRAAIAASIANRARYDIYYRTTPPDGAPRGEPKSDTENPARYKIIRAIGWTDYDSAGNPIRFDGVTLDATQEKRVELELKQARDAAESANRSKSSFLATMSHEIRTPLSAIVGFSELLAVEVGGNESASDYVRRIHRNSRQLASLIDELLDLSKIEANRLELEKVSAPLDALLDDAFSAVTHQAHAKGLSFEITHRNEIPRQVLTDPTRFRQILINLVGNAVKFTSKGGITVTVGADRGRLTIDVRDTGVGLSQQQAGRIFEPFVQGDGSISRRYGGTGLGLALSRQLARLLGGEVELRETERGATFRFWIPLGAASPVSPANRALSDGNFAAGLRGKRILVVDDVADNRTLAVRFLATAKVISDVAVDGYDALAKLATDSFDLVLLDLRMPQMDGFQTLREIRAAGYVMPVVALTAHALSDERANCLNAGFADFVSKPIELKTLLQTLVRQLSLPADPRHRPRN